MGADVAPSVAPVISGGAALIGALIGAAVALWVDHRRGWNEAARWLLDRRQEGYQALLDAVSTVTILHSRESESAAEATRTVRSRSTVLDLIASDKTLALIDTLSYKAIDLVLARDVESQMTDAPRFYIQDNPETRSALVNSSLTTPLGTPLTGHTFAVYGVAFTPDGSLLASAGRDGTVRLWNTTDPASSSSEITPWSAPAQLPAAA